MARLLVATCLALAACTNTVTTLGDLASSPDLAAPDDLGADDLAAPGDLAATVDLSAADLSSSDLAGADLTPPPPDLTTLADLATPPDLTAPTPDLTVPPPDLTAPAPDLTVVCNPASCTTPPANDCVGDSARVYAPTGTCVLNACSYASMTSSCPNGCYQGSCSSLFLGNTDAFITGTGTHVGLFAGTAQAGTSVSAITQTFPQNGVNTIHLIYSLNDPAFAAPTDLPMIFDKLVGNNDQWYAIIPAQPAGTHVYWYIRVFPKVGTQGTDPHGAPTASVLDYTN